MPRLFVVAPLLLAACNAHRDDAGAVSPEEDHMLNEAAAAQEAPSAASANATVTNTTAADQGNQQ